MDVLDRRATMEDVICETGGKEKGGKRERRRIVGTEAGKGSALCVQFGSVLATTRVNGGALGGPITGGPVERIR